MEAKNTQLVKELEASEFRIKRKIIMKIIKKRKILLVQILKVKETEL